MLIDPPMGSVTGLGHLDIFLGSREWKVNEAIQGHRTASPSPCSAPADPVETLYPQHLPGQCDEGVTWRRGLRPLLSSLFAHRYEVEINQRTAAENDFVVLKKVRETLILLNPHPNQPCSGLQPWLSGEGLVPEWGWSHILASSKVEWT